ncbi:ABC transporter ATP-binding protein [Cyanobacteria bacterium FACHB-502]|jgi:putative ABC transport system ATP-binding protein|nr:ABC transporter ATP-binding protein [Leptolyngbya sp. FACHB-711]MBD1849404.1 ABC transporter ATP-binding protein [Cyanobacteria bacterium FACHB-502]MBD2024128.1 ABC transporter ATP-binding protein [Leptolyngbya sp. FACHB-711]
MTATRVNFEVNATESSKGLPPIGDSSLETRRAGGKAIVVRDVEMVFKNGSQSYHALKQINLDIYPGEIQLLMGPSGSGKTTLLSILGGILKPTEGNVSLLGTDLTRLSRSQLANFRLKHIGFIFQEFNLFPALTALENIEVALNFKGIKGRHARQEASLLLDQVGLADRARNLPRDLSGGQKQRVAIARALAGNPQFIFADEPTASLDSQSGYAVITLLRKLAKEANRTVVMVTHDPRIIDVADRIGSLEDGILGEGHSATTSPVWQFT